MFPVSSSNLYAVGYDPQSKVLRIEFKTATYDYFGVPEYIFNGLMNASSKGVYQATFIKDFYHYKRI